MMNTQNAAAHPEPADAGVTVADLPKEQQAMDPVVAGLIQASKDGQLLDKVALQLIELHQNIWLAADHGVIYRGKTYRELTDQLIEKGLAPLEIPQVFVSAEGWTRLII
ncbi:MAG: hypothetical protein NTZ05_12090 [Chloroflexi bacterium]|nr:hypothetical protein [Chloroflexota bacterium]